MCLSLSPQDSIIATALGTERKPLGHSFLNENAWGEFLCKHIFILSFQRWANWRPEMKWLRSRDWLDLSLCPPHWQAYRASHFIPSIQVATVPLLINLSHPWGFTITQNIHKPTPALTAVLDPNARWDTLQQETKDILLCQGELRCPADPRDPSISSHHSGRGLSNVLVHLWIRDNVPFFLDHWADSSVHQALMPNGTSHCRQPSSPLFITTYILFSNQNRLLFLIPGGCLCTLVNGRLVGDWMHCYDYLSCYS